MYTIQKKICLMGDFAVGKTSLVRRFVENRFDDKYLSSIGVKISRKTLLFSEYSLNLLIWDLAGTDNIPVIESGYMRGAAGAILVCDLTRPETLHTFRYLAEQFRTQNPNATLVGVGNKADLQDRHRLNENELKNVGQQIGCLETFVTSAKTGQQVEETFQALASGLIIS